MDLIKAIIMGIVQGVAEFLPISSSGHLAIFKHLLNIETDTGMLFDIMLHFGTLVAIFIAFFKDIKQLVIGGFSIIGRFFYNIYAFFAKHRSGYKKVVASDYDRFVMLIIVSTIPTGIIGILLKDFVEKASESLLIVGICLLVTAVLLRIADKTSEGNGLQYGNYQVILTAYLATSYTETNSHTLNTAETILKTQASDKMIYTNARLYTDLIK